MKRREFGTLLGGTAIWSFSAQAQQSPAPTADGKLPEVGFLHPGSVEAASKVRVAAFLEGLSERGFVEGRNFTLLARFAEYDSGRTDQFAAELVERKASVIFVVGPAAVQKVHALTSTIPIVAMDLESDPVKSAFIASISRPGGNLTGLFFDFPEFSGKWLEILSEILPGLRRVGLLWDPATGPVQLDSVTAAVAGRGLTVEVFKVDAPSLLDQTVAAASAAKVDALIMLSSPVFGTLAKNVADLTLRHHLPAITMFPEFAELGGLVAYGVDLRDLFHQGGGIVAKVLAGTRPADLPAERPARFQLVVNLKTAKALGLPIQSVLLARADEVIE
jgi:putative tryptophan/tyrosine transport system substrate-binding protein